jgi:DNA polymerase-3 subunit gamma/tau
MSGALNRAPKSTSLSSLIRKPDEPAPPPVLSAAAGNESGDAPFRSEDLIRCWDACAETIEKEIHLKNTMLSCKPVLQENAHFEVVVHNPVQKEELIGHSIKLLKSLRSQLNNKQVQMHIRIDESNEKHLAYTSTEKYEMLNQINPLLSRLKDEFDLMID